MLVRDLGNCIFNFDVDVNRFGSCPGDMKSKMFSCLCVTEGGGMLLCPMYIARPERISLFGVRTSSAFAFCSNVLLNGIAALQKAVGHSVEAERFVLSFSAFGFAVRAWTLSR